MTPPSAAAVSAEWLVTHFAGATSSDIVDAVEGLIVAGELGPGTRMPTVRHVAEAAGVSIGTVADAWSRIRANGLIDTRRRGGTTVSALAGHAAPTTFRGWSQVDLSLCSPDRALQPPLAAALTAALDDPDLNAWGRDYMTERLRSAVEPEWPFDAAAWMTAGGGTEALYLATLAVAGRGSTIVVDEPLPPGYLDTLRDLDITPLTVDIDDEGPVVASLRAHLSQHPAAFVMQPGAPFAAVHRVTPRRARELGELLADHEDVAVIEDDSFGPLGDAAPSVGTLIPQRTVRIRTYCKAYGTDLRTSVIGGAEHLIDSITQARSGGLGSNSRILQNALAWLISDPNAARTVSHARSVYAERRRMLLAALEQQELTCHTGPESLTVWIEVPDELRVALALAGRGIGVGTASSSFVAPHPEMLRVSVAQLPDDPERIAELAGMISRAARGSLREYFD